jgi:hypothetical protein
MVSKAPLFFCYGECGEYYPASAFRKNHVEAHACASRKRTCKRCEQTKRDKLKRANRWKVKAATTIRNHARKYGMSRQEFEETYGWNPDRLARDLENTYEHGLCPGECGDPFKDMGHGLADITVDIIDRRIAPVYPSNVRLICSTDNRSKGQTPPEEMGERIIINQKWKAAMQRVKADPFMALPLYRHAMKASR